MVNRPRYTASASKALEVILWLAQRSGHTIDVYHAVKAVFFADKWHIARYGRPILGDDYRAAPWGPLGQVVYGLLRKDPFEVLALGGNGDDPPFNVKTGFRITGEREPNLDLLSASDIEALDHGWTHVCRMSFEALVNETHADPAWMRSEGGMMDYRDFLPDDEDNVELKRAEIAEEAASAYF